MTKAKDGRAIAHANEVRVLRALHRFGWLRTRDLAALVWQRWARSPVEAPSLKPPMPTAGGLRMAQRTLSRLREKRLVLRSRAPDGSLIYTLAEAGARALQQIGVAAGSGKDLLRTFSTAHFRHRCIANEIAVEAIIEGFRVATERETAQGLWLGGECGVAGKKPDVLLRSGDWVWWVEVERSRKNTKDYARLLTWLDVVARDICQAHASQLLGERGRWAKIIFICTAAFQGKLCQDLTAAGWSKELLDRCVSFETSLYVFEGILFM